MDVVKDDAKGSFRRIELLTGPAWRRRWSSEEKDRIVAETLQSVATVTKVARRWQVCPQQVWSWRREAREGGLALPEESVCEAAEAIFCRSSRRCPLLPLPSEHGACSQPCSDAKHRNPARRGGDPRSERHGLHVVGGCVAGAAEVGIVISIPRGSGL